ncbi:SCO2524 family protein [Actinoplanes solisilvae]|uniref:SCO2524 family protein n=1 Tax=Actinoplanes solisilvae TaxID=2486853 RepID=UPI000FD8DA5D|nr:SCO2524 family protein [Actinoplanes solisilvae]
MRVQPRQQLLDIWEAIARSSWKNDQWVNGGRFGANSISDAEQLLCLLLPATQIETFNLDRPDQTADRMVHALRRMGTATDIPRIITRILNEYFETYTENDAPVFSGGGYYELYESPGENPPEEIRTPPIVDSYALSITLSLATLGFVRVYRRSVSREDVRAALVQLEAAASIRLSAAMVGLLRSFSVNVFPVDSDEGNRLRTTVNQSRMPNRSVVALLHRELRPTIASFREVLIGSGQTSDLELPDRLFECGWSWSVVRGAPKIETSEKIGDQVVGVGQDKPYLYFTVIALNAVEALVSERTRILGLLNEEQQRLARALQLRCDLTRTYWATIATFGEGGRWPLENIPWRTTDGDQSDYFTLQVTALVVKGLAQIRGSDAELARVGRVLASLAERARVTSRPVDSDPNLGMHYPGIQMALVGSDDVPGSDEKQPLLAWSVPEFAALLLNRAANVAGLINDPDERSRLLDLGDEVWDHLTRRRLNSGDGAGLWDDPSRLFPNLDRPDQRPSWYYTERVVEALVTVASVLDRPPTRNEELAQYAVDFLREAEQIYDRELLKGSAEGGPQLRNVLQLVESTLRRAREILPERPGTAAALAVGILRHLDMLEAARYDSAPEA